MTIMKRINEMRVRLMRSVRPGGRETALTESLKTSTCTTKTNDCRDCNDPKTLSGVGGGGGTIVQTVQLFKY